MPRQSIAALTTLMVLLLAAHGMAALAQSDDAANEPTPDVSGTWALEVETSAGTGTPTLVLQQNGSVLTGTYRGRFGDRPVAGRIEGTAIHVAFTVTGPMGSADVVYTGTVEGDGMSGSMQIGDRSGGRFTGLRQR